jgi:DNA (cytosine-5)-methyltransferase 1
MGLDLGLESVGLAPTLAVEWDKWCCATIRKNRPELTVLEGDVSKISGDQLRHLRKFDGEVFALVGGPPCQSFSPGGNRAAISDPRGNLIYEYLRLIGEIKPRFFVLENVANLITAALKHRKIEDRPGKRWNLSSYSNAGFSGKVPEDDKEPLSAEEQAGSAIRQILNDVRQLGYAFKFQVVDAAAFGAPQHRLRFILCGARETVVPELPKASHGTLESGLQPWMTLKDVIYSLRESPGVHSEYTESVAKFFRMIPPGGYWKSLPIEMQRQALGGSFSSGGGKTGFFRRLSYEQPAPTVTTKPNRKGTSMCHPEFVRPISVRECARIQGFPDNWHFTGAMNQQYQQIGNAVPTYLGVAVGQALLAAEKAKKGSRSAIPKPVEVETMLHEATSFLRSKARNKRGRTEGEDLFSAA